MPLNAKTILVIDPDEKAAYELADLLRSRQGSQQLFVCSGVQSAEAILRAEQVSWLFIRIVVWETYQHLVSSLPSLPRRVVFLSGCKEKCTAHLPMVLDGHLQAPYRAGHLIRVWNRLSDPGFIPRPVDIFFIKSRARFEPVRYVDLRQVIIQDGQLLVQTRNADYRISGSLQAFQDRLPVPLTLMRRGCLVNEKYTTFDPSSPMPGDPVRAPIVFSSVPARW